MQLELTLTAEAGDEHVADDLGYLLHKHPARVHERAAGAGRAIVFYPEVGDTRCTAVLHVDIDPVTLVRGKGERDAGPLDAYVNDRPYAASSFLSVALKQSYAQSMAGTSRDRQHLADRALPFEARVTPVPCGAGESLARELFEPLGYRVAFDPVDDDPAGGLFHLELASRCRLADLLRHLYVLVPVLDDAKHWWVDRDEIDKLLDKSADWLATHPARDVIARRTLKHRRELVDELLARLDADTEEPAAPTEPVPERTPRLHALRLDTVAATLVARGARRVLDLGCGEGRLIERLLREGTIEQVLGVDPSVRTLQRARERLHLDEAGEALRERLSLRLGSLTYGDRRWRECDAATLVEVIEHVDAPRLAALERSLFADARPSLVVVTTPNAECNALFERLPAGAVRHEDHRFEWSRAEFGAWCDGVAARHGYAVERRAIGPEDAERGAPSQMATFTREATS